MGFGHGSQGRGAIRTTYGGSRLLIADVTAGLTAGILCFALVGKLFDPTGTRASFNALGLVDAALVTHAAVGLLLAEAALAGLLLSRRTRSVGGACTCLLAGAFTYVTVTRLLAGAPDGCRCFGLLVDAPRGVVLAIDLFLFGAGTWLCTAGTAASQPTNPSRRRANAAPAIAAYATIIALLAAIGQGRAAERRREVSFALPGVRLYYGDHAPDFTLPRPGGGTLSLTDLSGAPAALCFVAAGCGPCKSALHELPALATQWSRHANVVLVIRGERGLRLPAEFFRSGVPGNLHVVHDRDGSMTASFLERPYANPSYVVLDAAGKVELVQPGHLAGSPAVAARLRLLAGEVGLRRPTLSRGAFVADVLVTHAGRVASLGDVVPQRVLLLTAVDQSCGLGHLGLNALERLAGRYPDVQLVYLFPADGPAGPPTPYRGRGEVVRDHSGSLSATLGGLAVGGAAVVVDGVLVWSTGRSAARAEDQIRAALDAVRRTGGTATES